MTGFDEIYKAYFSDVFLYIKRLSGDEHVAEEIAAETFLKALGSVDKFRGECEMRVWLCQIAKNCYFSYAKKQSKSASLEEIGDIPDFGETPEEKAVSSDEAERIRLVLHDIPEPYKEVFMWRVFAELGFRQIGKLYGKTENWACVTYHRAKKMIKERLEGGKNEK